MLNKKGQNERLPEKAAAKIRSYAFAPWSV